MATAPPSFFRKPELDHAVAGIGAGTISVLCMNPLDLLKVKLQVSNKPSTASVGKQIWSGLVDIQKNEGWRGLYRGIGPNVAGNASSWGLYFLFYNYLKRTAADAHGDPNHKLSASEYLLYSAEASAVTAIMTNPIWVVKVRMFTSRADDPKAYRNMWEGFSSIARNEGIRGLWRGTLLGLFGVTNGAIQFVAYEKMKDWAFARRRVQAAKTGQEPDDKLSNIEYSVMSGTSKLGALALTYPYQVVRSRIQSNATAHLYPSMTACVKRTFAEEGARGFYRGLGTNLVRVLPGTCITFVAYENIAWALKRLAMRRSSDLDS